MTATAKRYDQPLAMALLDLDHFKQVNDRHAYAVGDEVLLRFTEILRDNARASTSSWVRRRGVPPRDAADHAGPGGALRAPARRGRGLPWRDVHRDLGSP
jgi:hypothetical protein